MYRLVCLLAAFQLAIGFQLDKTQDNKSLANIGGRTYYISPLKVTYVEAALACYDMGMELVAFETNTEFDLVADYLKNTLGVVDGIYITKGIRVYTSWMWGNNGPKITSNRWAPGQPSLKPTDLTTQGCLNFHAYNDSNWDDDVNCDEAPFSFICEQK